MINYEYQSDMQKFIHEVLADENSETIYYAPNNITCTYTIMNMFVNKVKKHPIIFRMLFKV